MCSSDLMADIIFDLIELLSTGDGEDSDVVLTIRREGQVIQLPMRKTFVEEESRYMVGVSFAQERVSVSVLNAMGISASYSYDMMKTMLQSIGGMIFTGQGTEDLTGPVGTITIISQTAQQGFNSGFLAGLELLLRLAIIISLNLALINLFPIPGLDGGKIIFIFIEMIRGKPVSVDKQGILTLVGMGLLILLAVVLTFRDVGRFLV